MSDGMFSRHATLNAGAIPASAEELSQRYLKLFQQYSRLKAQHAVLKKAVIKEQASNVQLQGNVKEKEKELRKLQEQLDLLAVHNDRLRKRIQAVQDSDQKGTHFSLLGGSVKKELEKSAQALDEANLDLERKIRENEQLHGELNDRQFEFTSNINLLLKQIQDLEKRLQEVSNENTNLSTEPKSVSVVNGDLDNEEMTKLIKEMEILKAELKVKTDLVEEKEKELQENDQHLSLEIQSLRAILLAQVGNLKQEEEGEDVNLYDFVPEASDALKQLEDQARAYFANSVTVVNGLSSEIADKLVLSTQTYKQELSKLVKQLEETKKELKDLLIEKEEAAKNENKSQSELQLQLQEQRKKYENLVNQHEEKSKQFDQQSKQHQEKIKLHEEANKLHQENTRQHEIQYQQLEEKLSRLEKEHEEKIKEMDTLLATMEANQQSELKKVANLQVINEELEKEIARLQQEIEQQKLKLKEVTQVNATSTEDERFVYPTTAEQTEIPSQQEEEEEEEVFVYRGMDAVPSSPTAIKQDEQLKAFYEHQIANLTEKLQLTDSKALRFSSMYKSLKERLVMEGEEKSMMRIEIDRLGNEVKKYQDSLTTTEINYQKQLDTMTEFISQLQQNVEMGERRPSQSNSSSKRPPPQQQHYNHSR